MEGLKIKSWEYEKLFNQESREKKKVGRGVFNRASRLGYVRGGVKTPYDYMSKEERQKLNGEVRILKKYNSISDVPTYAEFNKMDDISKFRVLKVTHSAFTYEAICKHWGITKGVYQGFLSKYNVVKSPIYNKENLNGLFRCSAGKYDVVNNDITELVGFPSKYYLGIIPVKEAIKFLYKAVDLSNRSRLSKYWGISPNTLYKIFKFIGDSEEHFESIDEYRDSLAKYHEYREQTDKEEIRIEQEEEKKEEIRKEEVSLEPKKYDVIEVDEFRDEPKIKYGGLQYNLNGIYNKEEIKETLPPIIGILGKEKNMRL